MAHENLCENGDFCTLVTTAVNLTIRTKNTTEFGKYKFSDSQNKYCSPNEHLSFEITVCT
jgi:hypothetical protein